jgi:hypothetical protein
MPSFILLGAPSGPAVLVTKWTLHGMRVFREAENS